MVKVEGRKALAGGECLADTIKRTLKKVGKEQLNKLLDGHLHFLQSKNITLNLDPTTVEPPVTAGSLLQAIAFLYLLSTKSLNY